LTGSSSPLSSSFSPTENDIRVKAIIDRTWFLEKKKQMKGEAHDYLSLILVTTLGVDGDNHPLMPGSSCVSSKKVWEKYMTDYLAGQDTRDVAKGFVNAVGSRPVRRRSLNLTSLPRDLNASSETGSMSLLTAALLSQTTKTLSDSKLDYSLNESKSTTASCVTDSMEGSDGTGTPAKKNSDARGYRGGDSREDAVESEQDSLSTVRSSESLSSGSLISPTVR